MNSTFPFIVLMVTGMYLCNNRNSNQGATPPSSPRRQEAACGNQEMLDKEERRREFHKTGKTGKSWNRWPGQQPPYGADCVSRQEARHKELTRRQTVKEKYVNTDDGAICRNNAPGCQMSREPKRLLHNDKTLENKTWSPHIKLQTKIWVVSNTMEANIYMIER